MQRTGLYQYGLGLLCLLAAMGAVSAARAEDLVDTTNWYLICPTPGDVVLTRVSAESLPGGNTQDLRIKVVRPSEPFYKIMITQEVRSAVPAGSRPSSIHSLVSSSIVCLSSGANASISWRSTAVSAAFKRRYVYTNPAISRAFAGLSFKVESRRRHS